MKVYLLFAVFLVFAIYKERQALGCPTVPDGTDCSNRDGKAVRGSKSERGMSSNQILDKISYAAHFQERWVTWRTSFMTALFVAVSSVYILHERFPTEQELATYTIVVVLALTLVGSFYKFHLSNHVAANIDESVNILRGRSETGTNSRR